MGKRVIAVDDEDDILDLLTIVFSGDVRCDLIRSTTSLDEAVGLAVEVAPDVIVLDLMFGHRTCAEILPVLRATCPAARIIVFTSSRRSAEHENVLQLGADHIAQKVSVSFEELVELALDSTVELPSQRLPSEYRTGIEL